MLPAPRPKRKSENSGEKKTSKVTRKNRWERRERNTGLLGRPKVAKRKGKTGWKRRSAEKTGKPAKTEKRIKATGKTEKKRKGVKDGLSAIHDLLQRIAIASRF